MADKHLVTVHRSDDTCYFATVRDTNTGGCVDVMVERSTRMGVLKTRATVNWSARGAQSAYDAREYASLIQHAAALCDAYAEELTPKPGGDEARQAGEYLGAGRYQTKMSGVAKRRVTVETREFVNSHGHAPRGRGGWLFQITETTEPNGGVFNFNGTYAEARKAAVAKARELGVDLIYVLP